MPPTANSPSIAAPLDGAAPKNGSAWVLRPTDGAVTTSLAVGLVILGLGVVAGWILHLPGLTQVVPGYTSMVFNTALSFALMGIALFQTRRPPHRTNPWTSAGPLLVAVLSLVNLAQIAGDISLGINAPELHRWMRDGNPTPGQMSTPTSVCFATTAAAFLLIHTGIHSRLRRRIARTLIAISFCIAGMAFLGYLMKLEALYSWYAFTRMAVHTTVAMLALDVALWLRSNQIEALDRPDLGARIVALATWTLAFVAAFATLGSTLIFKDQIDSNLADSLRLTHQARVDVLSTTLELRSERARLVAGRPRMHDLLLQLARGVDPSGMNTDGAAYLASFQPYGFSSIRLLGHDGRQLLASGQSADVPELVSPLSAGSGETRQLLWKHRFVLRQRIEILTDASVLGLVEMEQPLPQFDRMLHPDASDANPYEFELCGQTDAGFLCFPNLRHASAYATPAAARNEAVPLASARDGRTGVASFHPLGGALRVAAFGPIAGSSLAASTAINGAIIFAPVRDRLTTGLVLVAMVTIIGLVVLRLAVRPLTRALAEAQARYRGVVDSLREGVVLQDERSAVLAVNPAALHILGATVPELVGAVAGDPRWRLLDSNGSPLPVSDYPAVKALSSDQGELDVVRGLIDPNGRLRWLQISTVLINQDTGRAVVVSFEDITQMRLAQQQLEESEARYQLMVDQVADYAIMMLDLEGRVTSWNQGAQRITGYDAQQILGQHFALFFPEEDRVNGLPSRELRTASREGRCELEGWRVRKDGTRFWASMVISAIKDRHGALLGFAKLTRDLTERHRIEQELAEAWRRVQAMIDSSPFGIVAVDLNGVIQHMNPAGERMTGYSRDELVGKLSPAVYHDPAEVVTRARELSDETGQQIAPGLDAFVYKARLGLKEEREWTCVRKDGSRFPIFSAITALRDPQGAVVGYMGVAYDITERRRQEEYTRHIANHDYLTGLPMRRLLDDRLEVAMARARREKQRVGLLLIDLDHFKRINDSLGHHVGDELLKEVAQRLLGCVRASDTVARMGGDEFVILLPDAETSQSAERVAGLIVARLSVPVRIGSHCLHVTPSVGVAMFPEDADSASALLKHADVAMYTAKLAGRGCYRAFSRQLQNDADERLSLENDLRLALQRRELAVHFQPQVCLTTGRVIGMEALARWNHPERGAISPSQFIPIAEESDLIIELGEWVLREACRAAKRLHERTGSKPNVAVNLSARQFRFQRLPELVAEVLEESGLAAEYLELEITESLLMVDPDEAIDRLTLIRALGVKVAVDDFGTGYSSLAYVTRFPIDALKIDQSFVQRLPGLAKDEAVVQAIIALANSLGVKVVAEGVESAAQLGFLRARQCDAAQGFLFGKAVSAPEFTVQGFHIGKAVPEAEMAASFLPRLNQSAADLPETPP